MHTAMHLLGSLIKFPVTGGQVGAVKSRLDFNLEGVQLDKVQLTEQLNHLIESNVSLIFETITDAELDANPDLVRTMSVQPPRGVGVIRMVRIPEIDYQPCGGTHVANVGEIGEVRVSKIENKGKQNRRVHLVFANAS
jgi:misacylated tRNA(Ala) deacylase